MTTENKPSELEIQNAQKVLGFLSEMKGISFKNLREDIFLVSANEGGNCLVDVEESIVCMSIEVCDVPEENEAALDGFLMELNGRAVHGKFAKVSGKYFFRDNLEFKNLDLNELEASLKWCFGMVVTNVQKISNIISTGEIGEDIDFDSDEVDLEDLMDVGETIEDLMVLGAELAANLLNPVIGGEETLEKETLEETMEENMEENTVEEPVLEPSVQDSTYTPPEPEKSSYSPEPSSFGGSEDSGGSTDSCDSCD